MDIDDLNPTADDLDFAGVTSRYVEIDGVEIEPEKVPERFRHLIEYAKFWSIGDDVERSNVMWLTPHQDLKDFVVAVQPFQDEIDSWCSNCVNVPKPDEVVIFEMMLNAVMGATACFVNFEE